MIDMSVREMLEAGAHFGHQTHRWDPRMKPYIYGSRSGIHIIDLQKTLKMAQDACDFVTKVVAEGGNVLFVGTKRQAQPIIEDEAKKCGMFHVSHRWLGGTLTNFRTIQASIDRLKDLEKKREEGKLEGLTKKEKLGIEREVEKLLKSFGGIKEMNRIPSVIFMIDPHKESIAMQEAKRLGIPIVAIADTNCNPEGVTYLIPGNDDAIKSIRLFASKVSQAVVEGLSQREAILKARGGQEKRFEAPMSKEVSGAKGKAFVSKADEYEGKVEGEYKGDQAAGEKEPEEV